MRQANRPRWGKTAIINLSAVSLLLGYIRPTLAEIIVSDDSSLPPSLDEMNITADTETGLDWLDPSSSFGISYDSMITMFDRGDVFERMRYATRSELRTFFAHLGLDVTNFPESTEDGGEPGVVALRAVHGIGLEGPPFSNFGVAAYTGDLTSSGDNSYLGAISLDRFCAGCPPHRTFTSADVPWPTNSAQDENTHLGSWLVKNSVPEPAGIFLCGMGFAAVFAARYGRDPTGCTLSERLSAA